MTVLLLVRHGLTDLTGKRLYGRTPGIPLSEEGRAEVGALAERLSPIGLAAIYTSPLERCVATAGAIAAGRRLRPRVRQGLNEVEYGEWAGRTFASLRRLGAWNQVHAAPSRVRFPGGETLGEVQARATAALEEIARRHRGRTVAAVTHGDVIRLALCHFAGLHLDHLQRLQIGTASVSAVSLGEGPARVTRVNDTGSLADLVGG